MNMFAAGQTLMEKMPPRGVLQSITNFLGKHPFQNPS